MRTILNWYGSSDIDIDEFEYGYAIVLFWDTLKRISIWPYSMLWIFKTIYEYNPYYDEYWE